MKEPASLHRQRGASLLISLVFLVIMAMLGVTVANVTTMQERMAGHTRDRDLAFQAAEAALRHAEAQLADPAFRGAAADFEAARGNDAAFWEACFAGTAEPCAIKYQPSNADALPTSGEGALAAPPQYVLEIIDGAASPQVYRVTARAVGGTQDAIVVLQAEFAYSPPAP